VDSVERKLQIRTPASFSDAIPSRSSLATYTYKHQPQLGELSQPFSDARTSIPMTGRT
jgi:hypothetical protein